MVDAVSDIYIDWRVSKYPLKVKLGSPLLTSMQSRWVANLSDKTDKYKYEFVPKYYSILGKYYSDYEGPYLLGSKVTYADFAVYQSIDNDERTETLPVRSRSQSLPDLGN